jgi:hypothetical protein
MKAGVLTSNGYMRLDPNAIHWPIYSAGRLLARLGREEVFNCIDGLNQNGYAYEGARGPTCHDSFGILTCRAFVNRIVGACQGA